MQWHRETEMNMGSENAGGSGGGFPTMRCTHSSPRPVSNWLPNAPHKLKGVSCCTSLQQQKLWFNGLVEPLGDIWVYDVNHQWWDCFWCLHAYYVLKCCVVYCRMTSTGKDANLVCRFLFHDHNNHYTSTNGPNNPPKSTTMALWI